MSLLLSIRALASLLAFIIGLILSGSPVIADSYGQDSIRVALLEQKVQLDQQIGQIEQRIQKVRSLSSRVEPSGTLVVLEIEGKLKTTEQKLDDGVPLLEEYMVEDTYLDPFDEKSSEVVSDPWEGFNSSVFDFNLGLDRRIIRPVARGYHTVMPDVAEQALGNAFSNIRFVPSLANNVFQGKVSEAGVIVGRFLINSTIGLAGLFDVAEAHFGLAAPAEEDAGQTLAKLGVGAGPYLVLPFLPPTTLRDGLGTLADLAMDPLNYVLPFVPQASKRVGETVNDRAKNLEQFQGIEDGTLDLYAAVRDAYWQTRAHAINQ
ncbi:VacJ family lipoprotein [Candidatus Nitronereus thalassa]|uniref:VacJ family lipoprotein n=1 Tax=Candidatus Nitronereus thalassa TaxID=3020898 RepID=A0ABU3K9P8_9BACT|nr:VacJ family lipoprotein [Candidatus Nitronereus thalassa]MDT7043136.1 VacJ family lipoprotein [Candidatus Nitronereus thalassa]